MGPSGCGIVPVLIVCAALLLFFSPPFVRMWRNKCMKDFFDWCKLQPNDKTPEVFGMDCYALFESKALLLQFLKKHDRTFHDEVVTKLAFIDKFTDGHAYGDAVVHGNLGRIATYVQDTLTQIQSRLQWHSDQYDCTPLERLHAEQNCEVVIAADEYYRKCVSEPAGSQASWNARDQHMTTTVGVCCQERLFLLPPGTTIFVARDDYFCCRQGRLFLLPGVA